MKPQLYDIKAFDAGMEYDILFDWSGNQAVKNICVIKNNETGEIVYNQTQNTLQLKHTIPANTLTNGILYNVSIAVTDINEIVSDASNPSLFYCFTTPIFMFNNLVECQIVRNSYYNVNMLYSQIEGEPLESYKISLYDNSYNEIYTSGIKYQTDNISIVISNLEDNRFYYISAIGETLNGFSLNTGYIPFSVEYINPSLYSLLSLKNIHEDGCVKIQSNITAVTCTTTKDPVYINDTYIDLTDDILTIADDFTFNDDTMAINIRGYNIADGQICTLSNGVTNIKVNKLKGTFDSNNDIEKTYCELICKIGNTAKYYIISDFIDNPSIDDILSIWITRKNGFLEIEIINEGS